MDLGVFIPVGNNGWLLSETAPQYMPCYDLNRRVVQLAEEHGFEFALSMIKMRGYGGATQYWDYNLESFTLTAALAAVTERITLYASIPLLAMAPPVAARMATTIDSIAPGRFGVNIVTGWQKAEYAQMGMWPGDDYYRERYEYAAEYVTILRELWETGASSFSGRFFTMDDCHMKPLPSSPVGVVCAGQSDTGIEFCARHGDINFVANTGFNTPTAFAPTAAKVVAAAQRNGRDVGVYVLVMVIADETSEAAHATWKHYQDGVDIEALSWMTAQASMDTTHGTQEGSSVSLMTKAVAAKAVNQGLGVLVGSYEEVAAMLDEMSAGEGVAGAMLVFDDYVPAVERFGSRVQPLMACRAGRGAAGGAG